VSALQRPGLTRALRDEWVRCFGSAKFDHIVDFSGYSPFWMYVMRQGQARTQSVFLHNDLMAETRREVNGRFPHARNLLSTFETYRDVDNLISVSSALADINREKLSAYASPEKFVSAENTINHQYVRRMAYGLSRNDTPALESGDSTRPVDLADLTGAIESLMEKHTLTAIIEEATRKDTIEELVPDSRGGVTFVTAGRLSPEKNQTRLIEAFDLVHRDNPNTHLVILGSGPLAGALRNRIVDLGLATAVTLAGHQKNPYGVMAKSDCFVLSSDYEGQPMVLLEAMVLGLPIVTTDFASVSGALPEGSGYITPSTVKGLAEGMRAFLEGRVPAPPFDYVAYNQNAVEQFYRAIGAIAPDRPSVESASAETTSVDHDRGSHQDRSIVL
jgi:CDP-glycerol glycerophosphotransferase